MGQGKQGKKSNITFNDIQNECIRNECCFMDNDWKDRYRFSNQVVHTSPQGTFGRIGIPPSAQECMLAGRSDHGIAMPAIDAAVCLAMVSSAFFRFFRSYESIMILHDRDRGMLTSPHLTSPPTSSPRGAGAPTAAPSPRRRSRWRSRAAAALPPGRGSSRRTGSPARCRA